MTSSLKSPRIAITLERGTKNALARLAKREKVSMSHIVRDLVRSGLERKEDKWLSALADARDQDTRSTVSHNDAWK